MSHIVQLERALQRSWTRETLQVYADELQLAGDPRGDIIAYDLHEGTPSDELWQLRLAAIEAWLGPDALDDWDTVFRYVISNRHAFLAVRIKEPNGGLTDGLDEPFAAPFGRFVQTIRLSGSFEFLDRATSVIAAAERPWLRRLELRRYIRHDAPAIRDSLAGLDAFVAATPSLKHLAVVSDGADPEHELPEAPMFGELLHPTVLFLDVTGYDELCGLARRRWPDVVRLHFAFGRDARVDHTDLASTLAAFPGLRVLNLSRNEPTPRDLVWETPPRHQAGAVDIYQALPHLPLSRVRGLRVPSLRDNEDVSQLQVALNRMPELTKLEVARSYASSPRHALQHPTATIAVPEPCAWPPVDSVAAADILAIETGQGEPVEISLRKVIVLMEEAYYAHLREPARAAWARIWKVVDGRIELPRATLRAAFDGVDDLIEDLYDWGSGMLPLDEVHSLLKRLGADSRDVALWIRARKPATRTSL